MINIRPVSDLRNKFTDIEKIVSKGEPVYLTKNGYGTMVVMDIGSYSRLAESQYGDYIEAKLDEADAYAASTDERLTHGEVFGRLLGKDGKKI
jgi:prevent-host-death family protein